MAATTMPMTLRLPLIRERRKIGSGVPTLTVLTTDHLGTPAIAIDSSGNSVWEGGFEPFGRDRQEGTANDSLLKGIFFCLPGQWDDATWEDPTLGLNLYYNVHRWYEPQTGRYTSTDPYGRVRPRVSSRLNRPRTLLRDYQYADQNPILRVDPLGLVSWACEYTYGTGGLPPGLGVAVGGGGLEASCTSECKCGKKVSTVVAVPFGGLSLGLLPVGITDSTIELNDDAPCPDANSLKGLATLAGAGLSTPFGGYGCTSLNLGAASGNGCGYQEGADAGADAYIGYGFPSQTTEVCCGQGASR